MNKKKILTVLGVAAFTVVVALNVNAGISSNAILDMALNDAEAWAKDEVLRNIRCDISGCYNRTCHEASLDYSCPCKPTGIAADYCMYDGK